MIDTFYSTNALDTSKAFWAAALIGFCFGFIMGTAGLGSSRKITGIFYLRDMTVFKVVITAVLTCAFGLHFLISLEWLGSGAVYYLPTVYGAYAFGGLIFGAGFAMGGWCPATAAAGLAYGRMDALVFLFGAILGSSIFDDLFSFIKPLYEYGSKDTVFIYDLLGIPRIIFLIIFLAASIACFRICRYIEKRNLKDSQEA